jgi:hypothetical protein
MTITNHPLHRSGRALLTHPDVQAHLASNGGKGKPIANLPGEASFLGTFQGCFV